jgi:hypothetical protein
MKATSKPIKSTKRIPHEITLTLSETEAARLAAMVGTFSQQGEQIAILCHLKDNFKVTIPHLKTDDDEWTANEFFHTILNCLHKTEDK